MINYFIIDDSIQFYEQMGFRRVEAPWTVTQATLDITKPEGATSFTIKEKNKSLVASGEQSFLYLYTKGFLPKGQFQTVTPCFRDDPFDSLHTKYFIKNELIKTDSTTPRDLDFVIDVALHFFGMWLGSEVHEVKTGDNMYDIVYGDVELGSYGIRSCDFLTWVYGTGVAEPRLTRTMKKYGISH